MGKVDYYRLLGVSRSASRETIKRAFCCRVRRVHPDCNPNDATATEHTRRLVEAYRTLSDAASRQRYDVSAPCARPRVADRCMNAPCYSQSFVRTATTVLAILLTVSSALWLARAILAEPAPAHHPILKVVDCSGERARTPTMIQPDASECVEYYQTGEYALRGADESSTYEVMRTYDSAVRRAFTRGDRAAADFYKSSITGVRSLRGPLSGIPL